MRIAVHPTPAPFRQRRFPLSEIAQRLGDPGSGQKDLLIYLHIPFCNSKCIFCDWVTPIGVRELRGTDDMRRRYAEALSTQIRAMAPLLAERGYAPRLIYWGGGTPSKLEAEDFERIVAALRDSFDLSAVQEHSLEASPETLDRHKLETLRRLGVDRISIGTQSMDDAELRKIGRAHASQETVEAVAAARAAGFESINLDLIVGMPGQTLDSVFSSLQRALALDPDHVTVYVYRPSPGTVMARQIAEGRRQMGSLKQQIDFHNAAQLLLAEAGFSEYSFGYFAKRPELACRAEKYYFRLQGDYVGFGSGARSILGQHLLESSPTALHDFIAEPAAFDECNRFSPDRLEHILPSLRLALFDPEGIEYARFRALFGFEFSQLRRHPMVTGLLEYLGMCGTELHDTGRALVATEESRARGYIMSMLRAFAPLQDNASKVVDAFDAARI